VREHDTSGVRLQSRGELTQHRQVEAFLPDLADYVGLSTAGRSMLPTIWPGASLRITRCTIDDLELGDVVLFRRRERLILHRVVFVNGPEVVTRGDASLHADQALLPDEVLGRVQGLALARWQWRTAPQPLTRVARLAAVLAAPMTRRAWRSALVSRVLVRRLSRSAE